MALSTRDDYRQNATDCLRLARSAPDPSDRAWSIWPAHGADWRNTPRQSVVLPSLSLWKAE
jgi:hypothetical protein